ncbi:MAG TPA: glycosyltransferase family 9 protein [Actinomadura sp.]|jgi:ADP-heptose:LPS heptosyltransferase|nr:glycosyltransferase family 9 protein [Actinomadura sp.]
MPVPPLADPEVRRVAFLRARVGLGDLLCSVPALRALRRARPDVRTTVITWAEAAPLLARFGSYIDELLPFSGYPGIPDRPPDGSRLPGFLHAAAERRFDLVLQAYGDRAAANEACERIGRSAGARVGGFAAAGFAGRGELYLPYPRHVHEIHRHLALVRHLGVPAGDEALEFRELPRDTAAFGALARRHDLEPGRYAVLHPGASAPTRRWPAIRFAAVADELSSRGLRVVVSGLATERPLGRAVLRHAGCDAVDLTGATTLGTFAALLRNAALLVGNDTGTAHLAVATGTPSVTLFMAGDPVRWAYGNDRHRAVRAGVACSPCPHLSCPIDLRCAYELSIEVVLSEVRELLS